jgi:hypothetical protein
MDQSPLAHVRSFATPAVIPAKSGDLLRDAVMSLTKQWILAFAGMTKEGMA